MMNGGARLAAAIGFAVLLIAEATGAFAETADADFAAYRADVKVLKERMLGWCEANPAALETGEKTGALTERERFRKACGQALNGLPVPERDSLHLFYFRQGNNVDGLEYFGVRRALDFNGEPYMLITAWLIRTTTEVGQERRTTETADAFLMAVHRGAWRTAWRYVDLDSEDWSLAASDKVGAEILAPELEAFIDRTWKEDVVEATDRLAEAVASGEVRLVPAPNAP